MAATSLDLSQIKTDALSSAATFRTLIGLGSNDEVLFNGVKIKGSAITTFAPRLREMTLGMLTIDRADGQAFSITLGNAGSAANRGIYISAAYELAFTSVNNPTSGQYKDTIMRRDGAGILAQRNGTNAQTFRLYNTYTSGTSFENLQLQWNTNEARIGTAVGSAGGTERDLVLGAWNSAGTWNPAITLTPQGVPTFSLGTVTTSQPFTVTQTWNDGATTFTGLKLDITDTASASDSLLMDLQVGGISKESTTKAGTKTVAGSINRGSSQWKEAGFGFGFTRISNGQFYFGASYSQGVLFPQGQSLGWSQLLDAAPDLRLYRDAANTLAQRNGTNAQTFRLYNTYTSSTSFESLQFQWTSNQARIGTYAGSSGGSDRDLYIGVWGFGQQWLPSFRVNRSQQFIYEVDPGGNGLEFFTVKMVNTGANSKAFTVAGNGSGTGYIFKAQKTTGFKTYSDIFTIQSNGVASLIGLHELTEIATPSTPSVNQCRIYAKDNGSGKTQLVVLMPDGIETVLATET